MLPIAANPAPRATDEGYESDPGSTGRVTPEYEQEAGEYGLLLENAARASMRKFAEERTEEDVKAIASWIRRVGSRH